MTSTMALTIIRIFLVLNLLSGVDALISLTKLLGSTELGVISYLLVTLPYLILAVLLLANSYGYWKLKIWAYYFTFSQIVLSLLFFHTSVSFLAYFERFSSGSITVYLIRGISLLIEVGKCFLFFTPTVRQLFKNNSLSSDITYWRRFAVWSNVTLFTCILVLFLIRLKSI